MTERLLQFIWQFQYFNKSDLTSSSGEPLQIIFPGIYNVNQGPDFSDSKIRIGDTTWAGNVEVHFKTSYWEKHNHHKDVNYNNVILHVVWEHDSEHENHVPVLELRNRVSKLLLERYDMLMNSAEFIACQNHVHAVKDIVWKSWKERLMAERLIRKSASVEIYLRQSSYHWEEAFWWLLARSFGTKVNADAFEGIAKSIPLNILAKHKNQIHQLESLLMGQAGLLNSNFHEDYPKMLQKEYRFYKKKYRLMPSPIPVFFLRMRPVNFPSIRLAQLAMLVHGSVHLFSKIREAGSIGQIKEWFDVTANDYWHYHFRFDDLGGFRKKKIGEDMIDNIIINTLVPLLFAYGNYHNDEKYKQKALQWLEQTSPENNAITRGFGLFNIKPRSAFDSQALIELKNGYCNQKRCLDCSIGNAILRT